MLDKKAPRNGRGLYLTLMWQMLADKQKYFENHHHLKNIYHKNNLNQTLKVSQFYLVLLLILLLC